MTQLNEEYKKALVKYCQLHSAMQGKEENEVPSIGYKAVEHLFCELNGFTNVATQDVTVDCYKDNLGVALKTFGVANEDFKGKQEKVAEFDRDMNKILSCKSISEIVHTVSKLRNQRIEDTKALYGLSEIKFHLVVRLPKMIRIYEQPLDHIDIENIQVLRENNNQTTIKFSDGKNVYTFVKNKSTLAQKFNLQKSLFSLDIDILDLSKFKKLLQEI